MEWQRESCVCSASMTKIHQRSTNKRLSTENFYIYHQLRDGWGYGLVELAILSPFVLEASSSIRPELLQPRTTRTRAAAREL